MVVAGMEMEEEVVAEEVVGRNHLVVVMRVMMGIILMLLGVHFRFIMQS